MTKPPSSVAIGNVLELPISTGSRVAAQIVAIPTPRVIYLVVFGRVFGHSEEIDVTEAIKSPIVLQAIVFDSHALSGRWALAGAADVSPAIPMPIYRFEHATPGNLVIEDLSGERRREVGASEAAGVPLKSTVSPRVLEMAIDSIYGSAEWSPHLDVLRPVAVSARDFFG